MSGGWMNMSGTRNYDTSPVHLDYGGFALMHLWLGGFLLIFPLPVLVTWLLPVAGTTYKHVVIKVFDLLWFPVEVHTFPDWQTLCCCHCDQWVTMKREPQSDRAEIEHGEGSGMAEWEGDKKMHQLRFGMLIWKHIYSCLPVHSFYF